jgi:16S rRNA (uracil1498-N3)-methyltransferase
MQFIYEQNASSHTLSITNDNYRYLAKARRIKVGELINIRNLQNSFLYQYEVTDITKKEISLILKSQEEISVVAKKELHIGWCVIDPKSIEKVLPSLNEIGVSKITFIYCNYSQKNFKINLERLSKILVSSSTQSGRSSLMQIDIVDTIEEFLRVEPNSYLLNFSPNHIDDKKDSINSIVVGCEGGLTQDEIDLFGDRVVGLDSPLILKSESAVLSASAKIIL